MLFISNQSRCLSKKKIKQRKHYKLSDSWFLEKDSGGKRWENKWKREVNMECIELDRHQERLVLTIGHWEVSVLVTKEKRKNKTLPFWLQSQLDLLKLKVNYSELFKSEVGFIDTKKTDNLHNKTKEKSDNTKTLIYQTSKYCDMKYYKYISLFSLYCVQIHL